MTIFIPQPCETCSSNYMGLGYSTVIQQGELVSLTVSPTLAS